MAFSQDRASRVQTLRDSIAEAETRVANLRHELEPVQQAVRLAMARAAALAGKSADAERRQTWDEPPAALPSWEPKSPYVWLPKDLLSKFPMSGFRADGSMMPEIGVVLTVEPGKLATMNQSLSGILREYRLVEGSKAQSIPDHLPGVADQPGKKLTIRVEPIAEIASAMRSRFEGAVVEALGKQRGEIVLRASEAWLREQFQTDQKESRVVSVLRMDDGRYQVVTKSGAGFLSVGGVSDLSPYVPVYLRSLFISLTE